MDFRFDISKIFKNNISRVGNSLLPVGFVAADRRTALDTTAYVAEIINTIGQASAAAQGLNQPVTTSDRLRNCDEQVVYLMTEDNGKNGLVVGLLKIGRKSLYVFDKFGDTKHVNAPCVLDFYIHESRQRAGLGKILFEYMLEYENLLPEQMAIDRPSEKLLSFLRKHYALTQKIPQMNNFVIYDGFFASQESQKGGMNGNANMHITASPNSNLFGPQFISDDNPKKRSNSHVREEAPVVQSQIFGRYGAPRPICSLNQIIHNKPVSSVTEPNSGIIKSQKSRDVHSIDDNNHADENNVTADELAHEMQSLEVVGKAVEDEIITPSPSVSPSNDHDEDQVDANDTGYYKQQSEFFDDSQQTQQYFRNQQNLQFQQQQQDRISPYHFNKRQTGKKNISSFVVGTDDKIEFDQVDDKGFGVVKINRPIGVTSRSSTHEHLNDSDSVHSHDSERTHTADGYFDLKFFSHRLW